VSSGLPLADAGGVHRIELPTPFAIGSVNCYLIDDEPLTLLDAGPLHPPALAALELGMERAGRTVAELELIVITHQHVDHFGLAAELVRRSGARVAAFGPLAGFLADFHNELDSDASFAAALLARHGYPPEALAASARSGRAVHQWCEELKIDTLLADGERIVLRDRTLEVAHRPGHSPSDLVFLDAARRVLFAGDHLLPNVSPNPLIARPLEGGVGDVRSPMHALHAYIDSVSRTRAMDIELVLPGHGDPLRDHRALIDERRSSQLRRSARIASLLADAERSVFEIALELWGRTALSQPYLTMSEALGHVDLLAAEGSVEELERDELVRYRAR
jgi:glyoxylase-like metal-dependent hydrolase (beta-lactamase superfamily II)